MIAVLVILAGVLAWNWQPLKAFAMTGASYAARVGCSCRYVGGRSLSDCRKDFEPGMELVILSEDAATKSVTARFPLLATQTGLRLSELIGLSREAIHLGTGAHVRCVGKGLLTPTEN